MSNTHFSNKIIGEISYILLIIVEFLLYVINGGFHLVLAIIKLSLHFVTNINMEESVKQSKRNFLANKSINRGNIDANWQTLLSSKVMLESKSNTSNKDNKIYCTRIFKSSREKKTNSNLTSCINNNSTSKPQTINSKQKCLKLDNNDTVTKQTKFPPKTDKSKVITKFVAIDCEMVGIGYKGEDNMLARVSLVNKFGDCIYDKFVKPREPVIDYRTPVSGVRREDLLNGEQFSIVQKEVADILKGRILVGHSLMNDMRVLFLSHPKKNIRDTSTYKPFKKLIKGGGSPSLKRLAKEILGIEIQSGEHSSIEDAQAVMQIYCTVSRSWEMMMSQKAGGRGPVQE